jgi:hypothetical protein
MNTTAQFQDWFCNGHSTQDLIDIYIRMYQAKFGTSPVLSKKVGRCTIADLLENLN